jgi:hypothetical protein
MVVEKAFENPPRIVRISRFFLQAIRALGRTGTISPEKPQTTPPGCTYRGPHGRSGFRGRQGASGEDVHTVHRPHDDEDGLRIK